MPNCVPSGGSEVCVLVGDDSSIVPLASCLGCGWVRFDVVAVAFTAT